MSRNIHGDRTSWLAGVLGIALVVAACEGIQDPWDQNQPEWKSERFETRAPEQELRQRVQLVQTDR